jgi:CubicO group peptidase (beta-lactamase class C family)
LELDPASAAVSIDTVMWLASCSKLVTAVAALQCVERGLFTLDDAADVDRLLPEWKALDVLTGFSEDGKPLLQPAKEKITLRRLLTHTSGIAYDFMNPSLTQCAHQSQRDSCIHCCSNLGPRGSMVVGLTLWG